MVSREVAMCMLRGEWGEAMRLAQERTQGEDGEVYSGIVHFCRGKLAGRAEERLEHFSRALEVLKGRHELLRSYAEIEMELARAELASGVERGRHLERAGDIFFRLASVKAFFFANAIKRYAEAEEFYRGEEERLAMVLFKRGRANLMHAEASRMDYASFDLAEALECFREAGEIFARLAKPLEAARCTAYQAACYGRFIPVEPEENRERFLRKMEAMVGEAVSCLQGEPEALYEVCMLAGETYRDEVAKVRRLRRMAVSRALELFERALRVAITDGSVEQVARSREAVAACLATMSHLEREGAVERLRMAAREYEACASEYSSCGDEMSLGRVYMNRGVVLRELAMLGFEPKKSLKHAISMFERSAEIFDRLEYIDGVAGAKIASSLAYANLAAYEPEREGEYRRRSERLSMEVAPMLERLAPKM